MAGLITKDFLGSFRKIDEIDPRLVGSFDRNGLAAKHRWVRFALCIAVSQIRIFIPLQFTALQSRLRAALPAIT